MVRRRAVIKQNEVFVLDKLVKNAIKVQAVWRMKLAFKKTCKALTGISMLQSLYRGKRQEQARREQQSAATVVASWWRQCQTRRKSVRYASAVRIQTATRSLYYRRHYLKLRTVVMHLQRQVRESKAYTFAVVFVQSFVRKSIVKKQLLKWEKTAIFLQALTRTKTAKQHFYLAKNAVVLLQSLHRMNCEIEKRLTSMRTVITLQSLFRRCISQRFMQKQQRSAKLIQQRWRCVQNLERQRIGATTIQSKFRMQFARRNCVQQKQAVLRVQRWLKAVLRVKKNNESSILIQSTIRMYQSRDALKLQKFSSVLVQRWWKATKATQNERLFASTIQAAVRMWLAVAKFHFCKKASLTLQRWWKSVLWTKMMRSVTAIQTAYRMHKSQRVLIKQKTSALSLQRWWRAAKSSEHENVSAMMVQTNVRAWLGSRRYRVEMVAVRSLQQWWKSVLWTKMMRSVIAIQATYRMFFLRSAFCMKKKASALMQGWWRAVMSSKEQHLCALAIQSNVRGWILFKAFTQKKIASCKVQKWWLIKVQIRRSESAVVIQTKFRIFYYWRFFHKQKRSSALIQGSWRAFQCQKNRKLNAATSIQSIFRAWPLQNNFALQKGSICLLQKWARAKLAANKRHELTFENSVIRVQACVRRTLNQKKYRHVVHCAIKIQIVFDIMLQKRRKEATLRRVVQLQAWLRMHGELQLFLKGCRSCIRIQTVWRTKHMEKRYTHCLKSLRMLQARARSLLAISVAAKRKLMVLRLQRCASSFLITTRNARWSSASILIQRAVRCHLLHTRWLLQKSSVLKIQKTFRKQVAMKAHVVVLKAAIHLQKSIRLWNEKCRVFHAFEEREIQHQASMTIQRAFRCNSMARSKMSPVRLLTMICRMQSLTRKRQERQKFSTTIKTVVFIQVLRHHLH